MNECNCGQTFRTAEDYRDHLPCESPEQKAYRKGLEEGRRWMAEKAIAHIEVMLMEHPEEAALYRKEIRSISHDSEKEVHERILHDHIDLDLLRTRAKQTEDGKLSGRGAAICMYAAADEIERRDRELVTLRTQRETGIARLMLNLAAATRFNWPGMAVYQAAGADGTWPWYVAHDVRGRDVIESFKSQEEALTRARALLAEKEKK